MPRATKSHRDKKNGYGHEAWLKRKAERNTAPERKEEQLAYRIACLQQRETESRLTEKNKSEMERLVS
jgi:hypothetical protein